MATVMTVEEVNEYLRAARSAPLTADLMSVEDVGEWRASLRRLAGDIEVLGGEIDELGAEDMSMAEVKGSLRELTRVASALAGAVRAVFDELEAFPRKSAIGVGGGHLVEKIPPEAGAE